MRAVLLGFGLLAMIAAATPVLADDPADMAATAQTLAKTAPDTLTRRILGQVAFPTYATAKFRGVRAFYIRQELVNDQVIFCGELDAVVPTTNKRSGWTKFVYIPGDPTTLMTDTPGLGTREIGPQVRHHLCDSEQKWLSPDFTDDFQKLPKTVDAAGAAK
ncbi:MAG: hypothetical protein JWM33_2532 [Caulobacteraceae bacterium]|nr:hypothetical protein [Caulobacteraceae bacterium]